MRNDIATTAQPFLRWAGGKFHLARVLLGFVPSGARERNYYEPFLGAASLFFSLRPKRAYLSDVNAHLMNCYGVIRDSPDAVAKALRAHAARDSEAHYYEVRELYNRSHGGVSQAARFIYLNRTGFNGVFRVNIKGAYNVPYGRKMKPRFPSTAELRSVSKSLQTAKLSAQPYDEALATAKSGDFVYLDPPYPPINGTSYFTHYTSCRFGSYDQERVAELFRTLDSRGCLVMLSNANLPVVRNLYKGFARHRLSVTRFVSSQSVKHRVTELVITNYDVDK